MQQHQLSAEQLNRLPRYAYKTPVSASKILMLIPPKPGKDTADLVLDTGDHSEPVRCAMSLDWYAKHTPHIGGYFIIYSDGACGFMFEKTFKESHQLIQVSGETHTVRD